MGKPDEFAEKRRERMLTMQLVGPKCGDDQQTLGRQPFGDEPEQVQARGIRPMEIFDNGEHGPILSRLPEEIEHRMEQRDSLVLTRRSTVESLLATAISGTRRANGELSGSVVEPGERRALPRRSPRRISTNGAKGMLAAFAS